MRRTGVLILCLLAFCALPSIAFALTRVIHWKSTTSSATIYITFKIRHGQPKVITTFEFNNIPASCPGYAPTAVSDTFAQRIKVGSRWRFHATETTNNGRVTYTVRGRFLTLRKAKGTLRVKGTVPGCLAADTGTVAWTARK